MLTELTQANEEEPSAVSKLQNTYHPPKRDLRFWGIFVAITVALFTAALDLTAISTALPTIVNDLNGSQFVWIGSAYTLSSTAFLPLSGGLAQVFGRRVPMLGSLFAFALGSALCGAAPSMNFLIAGRTVQGIGGGGIQSLTQIILSDLVPLRERGFFNGLIGVAWALANSSGPLIGGAFAQHGAWRWLFYLNLFTSGASAILVLSLLKLKTPEGTFREKFARMDWIGNFLVTASSSAVVIALTWGGIEFPWSSGRVLTPLIFGLAGLVVFIAYDAAFAKHPIVPFSLITTCTGLSGYFQTFIMPIILSAFGYYQPVWFQACKGASPIRSGVLLLGASLLGAPAGILAGASVAKLNRYRPQIWFSWAFLIIACGLFTLLTATTSLGPAIGFEVIIAIGIGALSTTTYFPVLAPLPLSANAPALAFFTYLRSFGQVWGVAIGGTVLQNELVQHLPDQFKVLFPRNAEIAYAAIPLIRSLPEPLRSEVRTAFADGLRTMWFVLIGISVLGLICSLFMKALPLHIKTDDEWGIDVVRTPKSA